MNTWGLGRMRKIVIALPKGRKMLRQAYEIFKRAGYVSGLLEAEIDEKDHKQLEFHTDGRDAVFLLARVADIPQYIDRNWADIGVSAFDCYREYELSNVTAHNSMRGDNFIADILPDLRICPESRFCVAGFEAGRAFYEKCKHNDAKILTAATQHPNIAMKYFAGKGIVADIITVSGSTELMPKHGEVDVIFDIVETGRALRENGLVIFEEAMPIVTKILVSKDAYKYDPNIKNVIEVLRNEVKQ
jgi:ATP phosphoribosyltransferase